MAFSGGTVMSCADCKEIEPDIRVGIICAEKRGSTESNEETEILQCYLSWGPHLRRPVLVFACSERDMLRTSGRPVQRPRWKSAPRLGMKEVLLPSRQRGHVEDLACVSQAPILRANSGM